MTGPLDNLPVGRWVAIEEKNLGDRYPGWQPLPSAPITIDRARCLVDDGLITMAHRYSGDQVSLEVYRWRKPMRPHRYFGFDRPDTNRPPVDSTAAIRIAAAVTGQPEPTAVIADRAGVHVDTARKVLARLFARGRVTREYARHSVPLWSRLPADEAA